MTMFSSIKNFLQNLPGWHTTRKLVVIESDDWGSIRMPSKKVYDQLLKVGIDVDKSRYDSLDILESRNDLTNLFNLLSDIRSSEGRLPKFTFNSVMGNPDFEKIQEGGFNTFYYEHFFEGYRKYYGDDLKPLWLAAIEEKLIKPQFHAREHLNVSLWLKDLRAGHKETKTAFESGFYGLKTRTSSVNQRHYLSAYAAENLDELGKIEEITKDGLEIFEETFRWKSRSFIACNYVLPIALESHLFKCNIRYIQTQRARLSSVGGRKYKKTHHYTGQMNSEGLIYTVRNVFFEPYLDHNFDWIGRALKSIRTAFLLGKPAIICTHRINYVGGMSVSHRDLSLKLLRTLLEKIIRDYPDVEFLSSDELGDVIVNL